MFWLPLIALAASVGGTGLGIAGKNKANAAQRNVWADYRSRNQKRQDEANAVFDKSLADSSRGNAEQALNTGTARRQNVYAQLDNVSAGQPLSTTGQNSTVPTASAGSQKTSKNAGTVWNKLLGRAQSRLGSYQDWQLGQHIKNTRAEQELNRIGTDARSDLNNVVPLQLQEAQQKGAAMQGWGQLLQAAGLVAGMGAATAAPSAGAGAAGTAGVDFTPVFNPTTAIV